MGNKFLFADVVLSGVSRIEKSRVSIVTRRFKCEDNATRAISYFKEHASDYVRSEYDGDDYTDLRVDLTVVLHNTIEL